MRCHPLNLVSALALAVGAATGALWVRSYRAADDLHGYRVAVEGRTYSTRRVGLISSGGGLHLAVEHRVRLLDDQQAALAMPSPWGGTYLASGDCRYPSAGYPLSCPPLEWVAVGFGWVEGADPSTNSDYAATFEVVAPHWLCAAGLLVPGSVHLWRANRRRRRNVSGRCLACGYDLRASPGRCPECGAEPKGATP